MANTGWAEWAARGERRIRCFVILLFHFDFLLSLHERVESPFDYCDDTESASACLSRWMVDRAELRGSSTRSRRPLGHLARQPRQPRTDLQTSNPRIFVYRPDTVAFKTPSVLDLVNLVDSTSQSPRSGDKSKAINQINVTTPEISKLRRDLTT